MVEFDQFFSAAVMKSSHGFEVGGKLRIVTNREQQFAALGAGSLVLVIFCELIQPFANELMRTFFGGLVHPNGIEENRYAGIGNSGI